MPRTPRTRTSKRYAATPTPSVGIREERYLSCDKCHLGIKVRLGPLECRPTHRCQALYKAMPFDVDLPADQAPRRKPFADGSL